MTVMNTTVMESTAPSDALNTTVMECTAPLDALNTTVMECTAPLDALNTTVMECTAPLDALNTTVMECTAPLDALNTTVMGSTAPSAALNTTVMGSTAPSDAHSIMDVIYEDVPANDVTSRRESSFTWQSANACLRHTTSDPFPITPSIKKHFDKLHVNQHTPNLKNNGDISEGSRFSLTKRDSGFSSSSSIAGENLEGIYRQCEEEHLDPITRRRVREFQEIYKSRKDFFAARNGQDRLNLEEMLLSMGMAGVVALNAGQEEDGVEQQPRRSSSFFKNPLEAELDERKEWQHDYLKERLKVLDMTELFRSYVHRLRHVMLINYLGLQMILSALYVAVLLTVKLVPESTAFHQFTSVHHQLNVINNNPSNVTDASWTDVHDVAELAAHMAMFSLTFVLLVVFYNEKCFRANPKWHSVLGVLIATFMLGTETAVTLYFLFTETDGIKLKFGNAQYMLVVVYVFLPFNNSWHLVAVGVVTSIVHVGLEAVVYYHEPQSSNIEIMLCMTVLFIVLSNLVGLFSRRLSNIAFKRAFLDKRGSVETKFKLENEKQREENLLLSILPKNIMHKVKLDFRQQIENIHSKPSCVKRFTNLYVSRHPEVSILYADICNFTILTTLLKVDDLVHMLNELFGKFDEAAESNSCLRIKILGDCYYCVSGVPEYDAAHASHCVTMGFEMIDIIGVVGAGVKRDHNVDVDMRIGIHSGSVLSGLIGTRKWQFDVWSNDVTIANRMEQTGKAGHVHITEQTRGFLPLDFLPPDKYDFFPSRAGDEDSLLIKENIATYLIKTKKASNRRVSDVTSPPIPQPHVQFESVPIAIEELYDGPVPNVAGEAFQKQDRLKNGYRPRARSTMPVDVTTYQKIQGNAKDFMEEAVEGMPLTKTDQWMRSENINPCLLTFRHKRWGMSFSRQPDPLFKYYLLCAAVVFLAVYLSQTLLLPLSPVALYSGAALGALLFFVLLPSSWFSTIYLKFRDPHNELFLSDEDTNCVVRGCTHSDKWLMTSLVFRVTVFVVVSGGLFVVALWNLTSCEEALAGRSTNGSDNNTLQGESGTMGETMGESCDTWLFTDSLSLTLLAVWGFFRMNFLFKLLSYTVGLGLYTYCVVVLAEEMYSPCLPGAPCGSSHVGSRFLTPAASHLLLVLSLVIALHVMDRQMEYIMRLDFQWKQQLEKEQLEAEETHMANKLLLRNILPQHVAEKFLNSQFKDELYHESYNHVAVMFASIPNYSEFYKENEFTEEGKGCLTVLNEILIDFDLLTYKLEFTSIEKIKVVGSTYMAACGLQPGIRNSDDAEYEESDRRDNVAKLAAFAAAMFGKLETINKETYQKFELRIGIDVGPVIAGVIGSQKPLYDIWGNTVNVASRMDYTGETGKIHVTAAVGEILEDLGWSTKCRGEIDVKGKGKMVTYFVDPSSAPKPGSLVPDGLSQNGKSKHHADERKMSDFYSTLNLKKASLSSIKTMLEYRKRSFNVQQNPRRSSLPAEIVEGTSSFSIKSLDENFTYKTLPTKLNTSSAFGTELESVQIETLGVETRTNGEVKEPSSSIKNVSKTPNYLQSSLQQFHVDKPTSGKTIPWISERTKTKYYTVLENFREDEEEQLELEEITIDRSEEESLGYGSPRTSVEEPQHSSTSTSGVSSMGSVTKTDASTVQKKTIISTDVTATYDDGHSSSIHSTRGSSAWTSERSGKVLNNVTLVSPDVNSPKHKQDVNNSDCSVNS